MPTSVRPPADGWTTLVVSGELDVALAVEVREVGVAALTGSDGHSLRIELAEVSFMDSSGLGALISLRNAATAAGGDVVLCDPPLAVDKVLALTQLDTVFTIQRSDS
jgi:anti-sigma B factor antagonist